MASNSGSSSSPSATQTLFPMGPAGKRELRRALVRSTNPAQTIENFQRTHSLHVMMSRAFGTVPQHEAGKTRRSTAQEQVETLDTDSVMTFLSHINVRQHEVHKRIADQLFKQLDDEIRRTTAEKPLLDLLQGCWAYATTLPDFGFRPVLFQTLKQLGARTPQQVLMALTERDETNPKELKHAEIFKPLPQLLKRLCWEADWDGRIPLEPELEPNAYLEQVQDTLLFQTLQPLLEGYTRNKRLVDAANRPFVATMRDRRVPTTQRRALTSSTSSGATGGGTAAGLSALSTSVGLKSNTANSSTANATTGPPTLASGRDVAQIRRLLCDTVGTASSYRPKLLYALISILMAQHGALFDKNRTKPFLFLGGAKHLHCTLVADVLLSTAGPLPKPYQHVVQLARLLDEGVQKGQLTDPALIEIQAALKLIFDSNSKQQEDGKDDAPDGTDVEKKPAAAVVEAKKADKPSAAADTTDKDKKPAIVQPLSNSLLRQLNQIITSGLAALKEADPQSLFLNPVTDAIAPGYSSIIKNPMCIVQMEEKVEKNEYNSIAEWEADVKLVFKNCTDYNRGKAGLWFRNEAARQGKVFRDEILPQAKKLFDEEVAKRTIEDEAAKRKREEELGPTVDPLAPAFYKRRKRDAREEYVPSMQALACMLLADPFVVRIVAARALRELQRNVLGGTSLPVLHSVVPSLLQLLHLASASTEIAAIRGKRYFVPASGIKSPETEDVPQAPQAVLAQQLQIPFASLRRYMPLLLRLLLQAELDKRVATGGDWHAASQSGTALHPKTQLDKIWEEHVATWRYTEPSPVATTLIQGALVDLCQPDNASESLSLTYPKFAQALEHLSDGLWEDRVFFICLIQALLKHRSKLPKETRDAVVNAWLSWLRREPRPLHENEEAATAAVGSLTSSAHEFLIALFNQWAALGNLVLPRDQLLQFARDAVRASEASETDPERTLAKLWTTPELRAVKRQYERMLKQLPEAQAQEWKDEIFGVSTAEPEAEVEAEAVADADDKMEEEEKEEEEDKPEEDEEMEEASE